MPTGKTSYTYDGFGRLLTKAQSVGAGASAKKFAIAYTYGSTGSSVGHVTSMTYPSENRVDITYGSDGRVGITSQIQVQGTTWEYWMRHIDLAI